jgi:trehalose 2-sulfotransferase
VTQSFFICTTPRTGSSLLSEALEFTRLAGTPREFFEAEYEKDWFSRLGIEGDSDYIEKLTTAGMTANGV